MNDILVYLSDNPSIISRLILDLDSYNDYDYEYDLDSYNDYITPAVVGVIAELTEGITISDKTLECLLQQYRKETAI